MQTPQLINHSENKRSPGILLTKTFLKRKEKKKTVVTVVPLLWLKERSLPGVESGAQPWKGSRCCSLPREGLLRVNPTPRLLTRAAIVRLRRGAGSVLEARGVSGGVCEGTEISDS